MAAQNLAIIVNPYGGVRRGRHVLERVQPAFLAAGMKLDVHLTEYAGHATQIAQTLDLTRYDAVCVIGGDGTVHEVVNGLMQRDENVSLPLALIPAGTGNTLHRQLGCTDAMTAVDCILSGATRPLDVAEVTLGDRIVYCVNVIGWGAITDISRTSERLRTLGPMRYSVAALWQILRPTRRRATLILDGDVAEEEYLFVLVCNTKTTGSGMVLAPRAEIDDGKLDVVTYHGGSRWQLLRLFRRIFDGSHIELPGVGYRQVQSVSLTSAGNEGLNLDGEIKGVAPFSVRILPGALRVIY